ncbi:MAG TPA: tetratricopeptide repeat protein [Terriglobales bacterium]|nr:tetratricopeptide repeat protein [Terriglobales bacterium]
MAVLVFFFAPVSAQIPVNTIPTINVGGNYMESQFARLEFTQKYLEEQNRKSEDQRKQREALIQSGTVSALDLEAPPKAVNEFNRAADLLKAQRAKEAIPHLQKAIADYPKFISALNNLGIAYLDSDDPTHAREEFETAARLDGKFAATFVSLGRLDLSQNQFAAAEQNLDKAAALRPRDASILTALTYAQSSNHQYHHAIETADRVHELPHKDLANVHYIAASAAIALKDFPTVQRELESFLQEDPANPLAPNARYNLKLLADYKARNAAAQNGKAAAVPVSETKVTTFPNSDALKRALASLGNDEDDDCADCSSSDPVPSGGTSAGGPHVDRSDQGGRRVEDSRHGRRGRDVFLGHGSRCAGR